jgi:hypothetical protein
VQVALEQLQGCHRFCNSFRLLAGTGAALVQRLQALQVPRRLDPTGASQLAEGVGSLQREAVVGRKQRLHVLAGRGNRLKQDSQQVSGHLCGLGKLVRRCEIRNLSVHRAARNLERRIHARHLHALQTTASEAGSMDSRTIDQRQHRVAPPLVRVFQDPCFLLELPFKALPSRQSVSFQMSVRKYAQELQGLRESGQFSAQWCGRHSCSAPNKFEDITSEEALYVT